MLEILSATVPIFLVVGIGFGCTLGGLLRRQDMKVLTTYVVRLALPMLVFVNVSGREPGEILVPAYLLTYAVAALAVMALGHLYARARGLSPARRAIAAFGASGTNNGFVGFPVFLLMLPAVAGPAIGMDMLVDNAFIIPLALAMTESAASEQVSWHRRIAGIALRVARHPMVVAIALALLFKAAGVVLPEMIDRSVKLIAQSSSAVALFSIGGMLVGLRLQGQLTDIVATVAGKLLLMPLVAIAIVLALDAIGVPPLGHDLRAAAILTCGLPSMTLMAAVAERHGEGDFGAAVMMLSTACSFATLTLLMLGLRAAGWL